MCDLAEDARKAIRQAHSEGRCYKPTANYLCRTTDESGEAYALVQVAPEEWIISHVTIRPFRFAGVSPAELASNLAVVGVATKLDEAARGVAVTGGRDQYEKIVATLSAGLQSGWSWSWSD